MFLPPKATSLSWRVIRSMSLARSLGGFVSRSNLPVSATWQNSHRTPRDARMKFMMGKSWVLGMPCSTFMFL
jgi:hypothetical protein